MSDNRTAVKEVWHQPDRRPIFNEAEFYEPGPIVTVLFSDGTTVTVERDGEADYEFHTADDRGVLSFRTPEEFRTEFSDGSLPEDNSEVGWLIVNNAWFDLYGVDGYHLDSVAYDLSEALDDARSGAHGDNDAQ